MIIAKNCLRLATVGVLVVGLGGAVAAQEIATSLERRSLTALSLIELDKTHLGSGVAISPDGTTLVYVGNDSGLHVRDLVTRQDRLLLKQTGFGLDVFTDPTFSPDGTRVLFGTSGGTYYYPADVYSININGAGLKRITRSQELPPGGRPEIRNAIFAQYFYPKQFAPTGTKILLRVYDAVQGTDNVAFADSDGLHLEVIGEGRPLFWDTYGQAIYYSKGGIVRRFNLSTKGSETIVGLGGIISFCWVEQISILCEHNLRRFSPKLFDKPVSMLSVNGKDISWLDLLDEPKQVIRTDMATCMKVSWKRRDSALIFPFPPESVDIHPVEFRPIPKPPHVYSLSFSIGFGRRVNENALLRRVHVQQIVHVVVAKGENETAGILPHFSWTYQPVFVAGSKPLFPAPWIQAQLVENSEC